MKLKKIVTVLMISTLFAFPVFCQGQSESDKPGLEKKSACVSCSEKKQSQLPEEVTENIAKTMKFIKNGEYEEALKETASDGPLAQMFARNQESYTNIVNNLKKVPGMYGAFQDYSIVRVRDIDKRVYRVIVLYYTDTLPLKFDLVYYKTKGKWVSLYFFFNDEIVNLFDELYK